jgi:hypothetical protein
VDEDEGESVDDFDIMVMGVEDIIGENKYIGVSGWVWTSGKQMQ